MRILTGFGLITLSFIMWLMRGPADGAVVADQIDLTPVTLPSVYVVASPDQDSSPVRGTPNYMPPPMLPFVWRAYQFDIWEAYWSLEQREVIIGCEVQSHSSTMYEIQASHFRILWPTGDWSSTDVLRLHRIGGFQAIRLGPGRRVRFMMTFVPPRLVSSSTPFVLAWTIEDSNDTIEIHFPIAQATRCAC